MMMHGLANVKYLQTIGNGLVESILSLVEVVIINIHLE
jgi:hypothetical protein